MDIEAEVRALVVEMTARWNRKDAGAFSELFADDADFTDVIGQTAHGKKGIATQHEFPFTRNMRQATLASESLSVRSLGPEVAVALLKWTTTNNLGLDGGPVSDRRGTMQIVCRREASRWAIVSVLNQDPMGIYGKQMAEQGR